MLWPYILKYMATTKTTKKPGKRKPRKKNKPYAKKTDQLVNEIVQLRKLRYTYNTISKQVNVNPRTVKEWYYEAINVTSPAERKFMRSEETELNEEIIRGCKQDIAEIEEPIQPDWEAYSSNLMARAKAYDTWVSSKDRVFDKKQKAYSTMVRASLNIIKINGLEAPTRVEIDDVTDKTVGLDEEIRLLTLEMKKNDK